MQVKSLVMKNYLTLSTSYSILHIMMYFSFILMGAALFIMTSGTLLNSSNTLYSVVAGILFVVGAGTYAYDQYRNNDRG